MFFAKYKALVILAGVGLVLRWRRRIDVTMLLLVSVLVGGLVVVLQLWSSYHLYVMAAPIAALAVLTSQQGLRSASGRTRQAAPDSTIRLLMSQPVADPTLAVALHPL